MSISLRQLAHATTLARHRNFRKAAAELHISQPALTRSIKALESTLGVTLFDRHSSGLEPSPAGEVFLPGAYRVLQETSVLEQDLAAFSGLSRGTLVISTGPYPGARLVPDAVAALMTRFPGVHCRLREVDWSEIADHLLQRESDIAVAEFSAVAGDERFETEELFDDRLYFICRPQHPLAGRGIATLADLQRYPLVGNRMPERIARALQVRGSAAGAEKKSDPFQVKTDIATFSATKRVLLATDSLTLAPLVNVEAELEEGSMTVIPTAELAPRLHSGLIHLRGRTLSPAARCFVAETRRIKLELNRRTATLAARFNLD